MASAPKNRAFWRTDWFVGLLVSAVATVALLTTGLAASLERRFYDIASASNARLPSDQIAIIAIDDLSVSKLGRWPWPRNYHAELIDLLAQAKPAAIVQTIFFFEPQRDAGSVHIQKLKALMAEAGEMANQEAIDKAFAEAETALNTDAALAQSIRGAGNVLLPVVFKWGVARSAPDTSLPDFWTKAGVSVAASDFFPAEQGQFPMDELAQAAAGGGHLNQMLDPDGVVRTEPLWINAGGKAVPSLALSAVVQALDLSATDVRFVPGKGLQLGNLHIATDEHALMLPQFYATRNGKPAFPVTSFYDVLTKKVPAAKYQGKIVIIGATAAGIGVQFPVAGQMALSPAETTAHVTSSLLEQHATSQPAWADWVGVIALLLVSAYLMGVLGTLSAPVAAMLTALALVGLVGGEYLLLVNSAVWVKLLLPAMVLAIGHIGLTTKRFWMVELGKTQSDAESAEANRMMGLALQGQGQLDMAFDRFRRVPASDSVRENLYQLALDFERKRQFNKALAVYEYIAAQDPCFKDVKLKRVQAQRLSNSIVMGRDEKLIAAAVFENETIEKPTLGRYTLDAELGKGAMGVVYRGLDPKIGRVVALKTMALAEEFSGDELVDARARFFREAETAGRLQHPNIVTIFDAGEESDLAYIAMEFVGGTDLVKHTKPENLLPVDTVLSIVSRVSLALDYAHRQQVVHRDIKPANIMFEPDTNAVKVTDFGIARISDSYKTKTGLVLGTPSFMSPEQLAGASADGRSDLYSLGVTLYQLLTGVLPFRGDSMAELMYKITHEEAVDVRLHRPDLTEELARLVQRAVMKAPEARFQTGAEFALCLEKYVTNHGNISPEGVQAVTVDITMQNTIPLKRPARPAPDIEI